MWDHMSARDLLALAAPPCQKCGGQVRRVDSRWHLDEDGRWRPGPSYMVCENHHPVVVEPLS